MAYRPTPPTPEELEALTELGAGPWVVSGIQNAPTRAEAAVRLERMRQDVKRRFRELALELHPDRTGGDPAKEARFRVLSAAAERVDHLRIIHPH